MSKKKVFLICGARPNFVKIAALWNRLKKCKGLESKIVYTGQHYSYKLAKIFFEDLKIPTPHFYLYADRLQGFKRMSKIFISLERLGIREKPTIIIVVGDVDSTLGSAIVASRLRIPLAHVEAGLRSFDKNMPEEINRKITDHLSDFLFTSCKDGSENLKREGIPGHKIYFVGNIMIDTLLCYRDQFKSREILEKINLKEKKYALVTLHRPENVDIKSKMVKIVTALKRLSKHITVIFPAHPRAQKRIKAFGLNKYFTFSQSDVPNCVENSVNLTGPLGYLDFLNLEYNAKLILTDSGGVQEESTFLGVPCLTLRSNTERPVTIEEGTNILVGTSGDKIMKAAKRILNNDAKTGKVPQLWDGKVADRIIEILKNNL